MRRIKSRLLWTTYTIFTFYVFYTGNVVLGATQTITYTTSILPVESTVGGAIQTITSTNTITNAIGNTAVTLTTQESNTVTITEIDKNAITITVPGTATSFISASIVATEGPAYQCQPTGEYYNGYTGVGNHYSHKMIEDMARHMNPVYVLWLGFKYMVYNMNLFDIFVIFMLWSTARTGFHYLKIVWDYLHKRFRDNHIYDKYFADDQDLVDSNQDSTEDADVKYRVSRRSFIMNNNDRKSDIEEGCKIKDQEFTNYGTYRSPSPNYQYKTENTCIGKKNNIRSDNTPKRQYFIRKLS